MARKQNTRNIRKVTDAIVRAYHPEKIILFGSWAWGQPRRESDIDLFIVKPTKKKRWKREYEIRKKLLGRKLPPLDLLIYTPDEVRRRLGIEDFFIRDIVDRGHVLYERP